MLGAMGNTEPLLEVAAEVNPPSFAPQALPCGVGLSPDEVLKLNFGPFNSCRTEHAQWLLCQAVVWSGDCIDGC